MNRPSLSSFVAKTAAIVLTAACSDSIEAHNTQVADAISDVSGAILRSSDISGNDSHDVPKGDTSPDLSASNIYTPVDETPTCETYDAGDKDPCHFDINQAHAQTINQALADFQLVDQALDTTFSGVVPSVNVKSKVTDNSDPYYEGVIISTDKDTLFKMGKDYVMFTARKGVFNYSDSTHNWIQSEYGVIYRQGEIRRNIYFYTSKDSTSDLSLIVSTLNLACYNETWRGVTHWKEPWEYKGTPFVSVQSGHAYPTSSTLYSKYSTCKQGEKKEDICAETSAKVYATCPFVSDELGNTGPFITHYQHSFDLSMMAPVSDMLQQYKNLAKKHGIDIEL